MAKKKPSLFDTASPDIQRNLIRDVRTMALQECNRGITDDVAVHVARKILEGKQSGEALYRVTSTRLCRLAGRRVAGARTTHERRHKWKL